MAATVAALVLAGGAFAVASSDVGFGSFHSAGCRERFATGTPVEVAPARQDEEGRRVTTWTLDAAGFASGGLDLCSAFGEVLVESTQADQLTLEARVAGGTDSLRDQVDLRVAFARDGARLSVAAWEGQRESRWTLTSASAPTLTLVLQAPEHLVYDAKLANAFGDVRISGVRASSLELSTANGDARATGLLMEGNVTASSRFGDAVLHLASVQAGSIEVDSRSGDVEVSLPLRADVGYDVTAETRSGETTVRIGDAESYESDASGFGARTTVRSAGYAGKPTKVEVLATTGFGDVRVVAD